MDRRVTSSTWGPPPQCKQALRGKLLHRPVFGIKLSYYFHLAFAVAATSSISGKNKFDVEFSIKRKKQNERKLKKEIYMEGTFCSWLETLVWLLVCKTLESRKRSAFDSLHSHCTVLLGQGNNVILLGRGTLFTTPFPIKGYSCVRVFVSETSEILSRGNIYSYIFQER